MKTGTYLTRKGMEKGLFAG